MFRIDIYIDILNIGVEVSGSVHWLTVPPPVPQSCWNCGRKASETCSGCNTARYCGSFCQHKDWEKHHHVCGQTLQAQQQQQQQQSSQQQQQQQCVPGSETPAPISSSACTPSSGTGSPAATPPAATPRSSTPSTPSSSALEGTPR